jgi:hypothetical protein
MGAEVYFPRPVTVIAGQPAPTSIVHWKGPAEGGVKRTFRLNGVPGITQ